MRFISEPWPLAYAEQRFSAAVQANDQIPPRERYLCVEDKITLTTVGLCSIQNIDLTSRRAELGLMLLDEYRGKGVAKEVLGQAASAAFELLSLDELRAEHELNNKAAAGLLAGLGFERLLSKVSATASTIQVWRLCRPAQIDVLPLRREG